MRSFKFIISKLPILSNLSMLVTDIGTYPAYINGILTEKLIIEGQIRITARFIFRAQA